MGYTEETTLMILSSRTDTVWANSADSDQTAGCSTVKPPCSNFNVITVNFSGVQIVWIFTVQLPQL